ncbi:excinuclease UvrABC ATPase subunit [Flavobacterium nitrogenifigens]|uniref:Excinuclease UvrABC ATPase subunit n=2 Tax=Flavobacterium TaxID=237 RepID=A0A7W7NAD0_9FLAO|nr:MULTISPECIES: hypothetical protein [Flavobacterium]MBB4804377.1 excinuclease UvrABC ATPase subunit [Flavobacterium nitrogenifigens]MBB6389227.1 excinuclease UvrABC ATPase subunit [Flavobacterium notoginsengisoli]
MVELIDFLQGRRISILTPKLKSFSGDLKKVSQEIEDYGFFKLRINGKMIDVDQINTIKTNSNFVFDIDVVIDRLTLNKDNNIISQFLKSLSIALRHGDGSKIVVFLDFDTKEEFRFQMSEDILKNIQL